MCVRCVVCEHARKCVRVRMYARRAKGASKGHGSLRTRRERREMRGGGSTQTQREKIKRGPYGTVSNGSKRTRRAPEDAGRGVWRLEFGTKRKPRMDRATNIWAAQCVCACVSATGVKGERRHIRGEGTNVKNELVPPSPLGSGFRRVGRARMCKRNGAAPHSYCIYGAHHIHMYTWRFRTLICHGGGGRTDVRLPPYMVVGRLHHGLPRTLR